MVEEILRRRWSGAHCRRSMRIPDWVPGKQYQERRGPKPALTPQAKACIAKSAMRMKEAGLEPTYPLIVGNCPLATTNPDTEKTVGKKRVYDVFRAQCYDEDPEDTWENRERQKKNALTESNQERRWTWAPRCAGQKLPEHYRGGAGD